MRSCTTRSGPESMVFMRRRWLAGGWPSSELEPGDALFAAAVGVGRAGNAGGAGARAGVDAPAQARAHFAAVLAEPGEERPRVGALFLGQRRRRHALARPALGEHALD